MKETNSVVSTPTLGHLGYVINHQKSCFYMINIDCCCKIEAHLVTWCQEASASFTKLIGYQWSPPSTKFFLQFFCLVLEASLGPILEVMETSTFVLPYEPLISVNWQFPRLFCCSHSPSWANWQLPNLFCHCHTPTTYLTLLQQIQAMTNTLTHNMLQ